MVGSGVVGHGPAIAPPLSPFPLTMPCSLETLNQLQRSDFVALLGPVFEATPTIAEAAWSQRPFGSKTELHDAMVGVMASLSPAQQLALIRAHPALAAQAPMAVASVEEQAGAGLDRLSPSEFEQFRQLNLAYQERFGFPFIIAVNQQTKASILAAFKQRLANAPEVEQAAALREIAKIAELRLERLVE